MVWKRDDPKMLYSCSKDGTLMLHSCDRAKFSVDETKAGGLAQNHHGWVMVAGRGWDPNTGATRPPTPTNGTTSATSNNTVNNATVAAATSLPEEQLQPRVVPPPPSKSSGFSGLLHFVFASIQVSLREFFPLQVKLPVCVCFHGKLKKS